MENLKPVLVVGSTGFLGTEICRLLVAQNKNVKALVRETSDPFRIRSLSQLGVETVTGDLKDPASLARALEGVGAVISTASSTLSQQQGDNIETVDRLGQLNLVEAAKNGDVDKFVFISFMHSEIQFPLQDAKREVEESIKASGIQHTILRPTFFSEVWLGPQLGFDPANGCVRLYGSGTNQISWISVRDVAAFAVASLEARAAVNKMVDLGGPEALSPFEVVRVFEEKAGRKFTVQQVPEEALRAQMEGPADPLQRSFAALMLTYSAGCVIPMDQTAQEFGVELTPVSDYCNAVMEQVPEASSITF